MSSIVKVEDVMQIVGMKSYIEALSYDSDKLKYLGYVKGKIEVTISFLFDDNKIDIRIDKAHNIKSLNCSCHKEYCPHIALSVMYLLSHQELITEVTEELNNQYDLNFNNLLFQNLIPITTRTPLYFDIALKYRNLFEYELQLKIGEDKKYVLKKNLEEFLKCYKEEEGIIEFGKNFTYDASIHYFNESETEIINFLQIYVDAQQNNNRNYYYYNTVSSIILSGEMLKSFLSLLKSRNFSIEEGYYTEKFKGIIDNSPIKIHLKANQNNVEVNFDYDQIDPITSDFSYIRNHNNIYYIGKENGKIVNILLSSQKKKIIFREEELSNFSSYLLPKLEVIDKNIDIDTTLKQKFTTVSLKPKYYFSREKDKIIGEIKLCYNDIEKNIFDTDNRFGDSYVTRNLVTENKAIDLLYNHHFKKEENKFILEIEDYIIAFLEHGLIEISSENDTYVSKNLKDVHIINKTNVQTSFGIGKDNILKYQFKIENIDSKEIDSLLDAVKMKKKYYKLKSGDYLNLEENKQLKEFSSMIDQLDINKNDLKKEQIILPKYKSIMVGEMANSYEFISLNESIQNLLERFQQYKSYQLDLKDKILRDYQLTGVKWMMTLSKCGFGGILADEMGLGKSLQTITYIRLKIKENPNSKFLIVVPTSLIYNWQAEFNKFAKDVSYLIINDSKKRRIELLEENQASVIITTYGLLRQDIEIYQEINFDTCIIDEAQAIKNINAETTRAVKMIHSETKFALTGTPIENSILELWSIFDFIMPGLLPSLSHFKSKYSIKVLEEQPEKLETLNHQIAPFILRRKKKDVLKDLPDKIENNILVELNEDQKKLYLAQLQRTKREIENTIEEEGFMKSQILILSLLTKLRQICIHPKLLLEDCEMISSKFETLIDILKQVTPNHKVLIFSQFPSALRILREDLDQEHLTYYYLDGSTKSKIRMDLVNQFNQDKTNIFLISLKAGGTGLNLTSADIVIHLDPWWNPQVENQATDRTHRIGQKNVVEVVKLIAKGTIEEKIVELQQKKKNLSDQVIEGKERDQIVLSRLSEKELYDLLDYNN